MTLKKSPMSKETESSMKETGRWAVATPGEGPKAALGGTTMSLILESSLLTSEQGHLTV